MSTGFALWWREVGAAALLGTSRRPVPTLTDLGVAGLTTGEHASERASAPTSTASASPGGRGYEALLTSAALGGMALLAGRRPRQLATRPSAAPDVHLEAPALAVQLLELVLTQPPAGADRRTALLNHWLGAAAAAGRRAPHGLLPSLLEVATGSHELCRPTVAVLDHRGEWLAAQRPEWAWVAELSAISETAVSAPDPDDWARLPSAERPAVVASLRTTDPGAARLLVESTWESDPATARRAHLEALQIGLGPDDEPLLERALDDRAASVREVATGLLDALPGSARAGRMADRLRPLLRHKGVLRHTLDVALPDEPDAAAIRDGLGKPPPRRSARGWWLERLAAGAPLEVWTDVTGADPATTLSRLSETDALSGIREAVRRRRDSTWATALLQRDWDPTLVTALDPSAREDLVLARLASAQPESGMEALGSLSTPWSARFSIHVVAALAAAKAPALQLGRAMPHLLEGLHPDASATLEAWLARTRDETTLATALRDLLQFHSVKRSITEAFR